MTDSLFARATASEPTEYVVERTDDVAALTEVLVDDRLIAAYALAQLEPAAFLHAEWWQAHGPQGRGLVCRSRAGLGDATYVQGAPDAIEAILSIHAGAALTFATFRPEQRTAVERIYRVENAAVMRRLHVTRERFTPAEGSAVRLSGRQVQAINRLYSAEGAPSGYTPHHIEDGRYFGVVQEGRLMAIAGTHSISRTHRIAVLGNVFTHPSARGKGYARLATSAVTADLLHHCTDVVLSVDPKNTPAIRAYERLGYTDAGPIMEASARRRASAASMAIRRLQAGFRGRAQGVEVVRRSF